MVYLKLCPDNVVEFTDKMVTARKIEKEMDRSNYNLLFGDTEEDYGESCVKYPGSVSRRRVRFWYLTVTDTEPFAMAAGPSLRTTVGIGSVPGHR